MIKQLIYLNFSVCNTIFVIAFFCYHDTTRLSRFPMNVVGIELSSPDSLGLGFSLRTKLLKSVERFSPVLSSIFWSSQLLRFSTILNDRKSMKGVIKEWFFLLVNTKLEQELLWFLVNFIGYIFQCDLTDDL